MLPPLFLDVQPHHRVSLVLLSPNWKAYEGIGNGHVCRTGLKGHFMF